MKLGEPTTIHDVHRTMRVTLKMLSDSADRVERLVETQGPASLLHKEVFIQHRSVAAMDLLVGLMESVYARQKQND